MHKSTAKQFIEWGLSPISLSLDKTPDVFIKGDNGRNTRSWKGLQNKPMDDADLEKQAWTVIGLVTGSASGGIEVLDIDCKYDLTGKMFEKYKEIVQFSNETLWDALVIEKTVNGGYHILYRCEELDGNQKLAERPTTEEERKDNPRDKKRVLIETRGEGGYIACAPSNGYEIIQGSFDNIPIISVEERETLMSVARMFDKSEKVEAVHKAGDLKSYDGKTPLDAYNENADVVQLLKNHGWREIRSNSERTYLQRPGKKDLTMSANYHHGLKKFYVFSTSTEFDAEVAYSPSGVYAMLECGGDFKEAAKRLYAEGYGDRKAVKSLMEVKDPTVALEKKYDNLSFLANNEDIDKMLEMYDRGTLPMGLTTGYEDFDLHFRFKRGKFNMVLGHPNVGKTTVLWLLIVLSNVRHGWRWIIYTPENTGFEVTKDFVKMYVGKEWTQCNEIEKKKGLEWVRANFRIIETEDLLDYKTLLKFNEELIKTGEFQAVMIDPYNSLDYNWMDFDRREGTHEYHYKVASIFKQWAKNNNCTIFLNVHTVTESQRSLWPKGKTLNYQGEEYDVAGHVRVPYPAEVEGGAKFVNKADDILVIQRYTRHPMLKNWTEVHVTKVKEKWSGGEPTMQDSPIRLRMGNENSFFGFFDEYNKNPLRGEFKKKEEGIEVPMELNNKFPTNSAPHPDNWTAGVNENYGYEDAPF